MPASTDLEQLATLVAALVVLLALWLALRKPRSVKVITVIDGDTVMSVDARGVRRKLRLYGIDAPETGQRHADQAKAVLKDIVAGRWVDVRWRGRDRYRRHVASLKVQGVDPAVELVKLGLALPLAGSGLGWHSVLARATLRGVWRPGARPPHESWKRKSRLLGWLAWKQDTRRRRAKRRR